MGKGWGFSHLRLLFMGHPGSDHAYTSPSPVQCEEASNLPSFLNTATPASQNEAWARLNNDPLLMVSTGRVGGQVFTLLSSLGSGCWCFSMMSPSSLPTLCPSPPPAPQIKKRQADQLKTIRENPMKMQQIIQEV